MTAAVNVVPLRPGSRWLDDARGEGRTLRVSSHPEAALVTVSLWRDEACTASVRLTPREGADLVAALGSALADCAQAAVQQHDGPETRPAS